MVGGNHAPASPAPTVCVTGAAGFVGSWLVMKLLQRGYIVHATVRDPGNIKKVKHLLELPKAEGNLKVWKGVLEEEGSFDEAIAGCEGVFHVAAAVNFASKDPEMYFASKTLAEKEAWKAAKEKEIEFISIIPPLVIGPFLIPTFPLSLVTALSPILTSLFIGHFDRFKGIEKELPIVSFSSKKLQEMGFEFKYTLEDMYRGAIETLRKKGLLPYSTKEPADIEQEQHSGKEPKS
nr:dihydroflavonol 4-reductase [Ipomoea batatas]